MSDWIGFANLPAQYRSLEAELASTLSRVLRAGQFILGPETRAFEREFARFCGSRCAVGCANGTDALELCLRGLGIGPGHEVVVPAFGFFATAEAVCATGAAPAFVDVEPDTGLIDASRLESVIGERTRAIVVVHLFGNVCDVNAVREMVRARELFVVEDAAQAHGARLGEHGVGSLGDAAAFSFYPGKNLGAYGDGGAVTTSSERLDEWLRMARQHGSRKKFEHHFLGRNSRLDELQAAVLRVKLQRLHQWLARRKHVAERYDEALGRGCAQRLGYRLREGSANHLYVLSVPDRDRWARRLRELRIQSAVHYPSTLAAQPALASNRHDEAALPNARELCQRSLSIPIHADLEEAEIDRVCRALRELGGAR